MSRDDEYEVVIWSHVMHQLDLAYKQNKSAVLMLVKRWVLEKDENVVMG